MSRMQPDYSRQILLKDVGAGGQAILAQSRVLIVGAGGLGSPVLQYLAGAGVGFLGLVEADVLQASNLHRQPIYELAHVGRPKAALAAAAVAKLNPTVQLETHAEHFGADNALRLVRAHDVVVDCTDNFRTKFLINDAAVLAERPAVFASVYQYEGQLQVYQPLDSHGCLRCVWAEATADGVVGNCAEAGVLGPVPGAFGALQALLTLKILLKMRGQLEGELLLMDFTSFTSTKLKAPRRRECVAPRCAVVRELERDDADIEIALDSLEEAAHTFRLIDVRTPEEFAVRPTAARHVPMATLLADPTMLAANAQYLLICASGKRSLAAARELRKLGLSVRSLAGGLQRLRP
jgi:molybdopterin/thiamine biosynthesis adenylyltransferase/rhodanese-related sulfurtransferase